MLLHTVLRFVRSVMIAYIPCTIHSIPVYYACSTTTVWERFIDAYCSISIDLSIPFMHIQLFDYLISKLCIRQKIPKSHS